MIVLKILGCILLLLVLSLCAFLIFLYLREWYAKWQGEKELSRCLEKYEAIRKEIQEVSDEIGEIMSQHNESLTEDEWRGYCAQLDDGESGIDSMTCLYGLIWLMHNHRAKEWELCPEQCKRLDELQICLKIENRLVAHLEKIGRPYSMSHVNYSSWRKYCEERNSVA